MPAADEQAVLDATQVRLVESAELRRFLNNNESAHGGSYFAVIEFAQRFLGVRWYMPGPLGEEAPRRSRIAIPADLDLTVQPRFAIRSLNVTLSNNHDYMQGLQKQGLFDGDYFDAAGNAEAVRWGRRLRHGNTFALDIGHAWYLWLPAEKPSQYVSKTYGKEHPKYYALRNGRRYNHYRDGDHSGQLCVSNPDVARTYAENIIAYSQRTGVKSFSLSCNDGGEHCECERCRAWDVETDANGEPILTDRLARFANAVAEQVAAAVPDASFGLYAYHDTRVPPRRTTVQPSIILSDVYNYLPFLFHSPAAKPMMEADIRGWRAQSQRVVLTTDYTGEGFGSLPWSTLDAQGWLMKLLAEYPSSAGLRMCYTAPGDLPPMGMLGADPWVLSRLMWDPAQSVEELTREFYRGAFGVTAGALLREYFDTINRSLARAIAQHPVRGRHGDSSVAGAALIVAAYTPVREECRALIQQAVAAVANSDERYHWRVDRVARGWRLVELTLDGVEAANVARQTTGPGRQAAWERAVSLGRERRALVASPDSRFALAPYSLDYMDKHMPLGLFTELPGGENLVLDVPRVNDHLVIDGQLDEPAWQRAARSSSFKENLKAGVPIAATQVRVFASESGLCVGFQCAEPQMADLRVADDPDKIWNGDVAEIYLVPTGSLDSYVQFSVNPTGIGKAIIHRGGRGLDMNWQTDWKYAARKATDSHRPLPTGMPTGGVRRQPGEGGRRPRTGRTRTGRDRVLLGMFSHRVLESREARPPARLRRATLDQLAAEGARFRHADSAVPSCIPARTILLTGLNQWPIGLLGMGYGGQDMRDD